MTINVFQRQLTVLMLNEGQLLPQSELSKLENMDMKLVVTPSADQFQEMYWGSIPDFVILNINDAGVGLDICHTIRKNDDYWDLPIVVLSEDEDQQVVNSYFKARASEVLCSPICATSLYWRIKNWLSAIGTYDNLHEKNHFINMMHSLNKIGYWYWDLKTNDFTFTRSLYAFLGIDLEKSFTDVQNFLSFVHPNDRKRMTNIFESTSENIEMLDIEHRMVTHSQQTLVVHHTISPMRKGGSMKLSGMVQDITERRRAEDTIVSLSYYDSLTGLPNREFLLQHLNYTLEFCKRHNKMMALLSIGVDSFSRVNSSLGNFKGDRLLSAVAKRLESTIRSCDLMTVSDSPVLDHDNIDENELKLAKNLLELPGFDNGDMSIDVNTDEPFIGRIQGDNFHIILSEMAKPVDAAVFAVRMKKSFETPFDIGGQEVFLSASVGIAIYPENGQTPEDLMTNADSAQVMAKQAGGSCFRYYSEEFNEGASHRFKLENDLRKAMDDGEFELYYQPKIDIQNQKLIGAEALIRWNSKTRGFVSPLEFIPLCEQTGLIKPLGEWVAQKAFQQAKIWQKNIEGFTVAVNVSGVQLMPSFIEYLQLLVQEFPKGGSLLGIEITEGVFLDNKELVSVQLNTLRESDIKISIDDFGTGFSSLSVLRDLPVDTLKIDRSFLVNLEKDEVSRAIVQAVLTLAQGLNLSVVAEGVEDKDQLDFLISNGCHIVQGFLFSQPLCVADFNLWVKKEGWKAHFQ